VAARVLHAHIKFESEAARRGCANLQQAGVLTGGAVVAEAVGEKQARVVNDTLKERQGKDCHVQGSCNGSSDEAGAG
jgi:hypothetical protein